ISPLPDQWEDEQRAWSVERRVILDCGNYLTPDPRSLSFPFTIHYVPHKAGLNLTLTTIH
ncbi:MAG: hypothetical protein NTX75_10835, partial [Proteobacteria bacterium]|nr:hypothetical protein [Pseudomonadota bacterium]